MLRSSWVFFVILMLLIVSGPSAAQSLDKSSYCGLNQRSAAIKTIRYSFVNYLEGTYKVSAGETVAITGNKLGVGQNGREGKGNSPGIGGFRRMKQVFPAVSMCIWKGLSDITIE